MSDETLPIQVSASSVWPVVASVLRHLLTLGGGILVTKGFLEQSAADQAVEQIVGLALAVGPGLVAGIIAKIKHDRLVTAATYAPNDVAVVK